MIDVEIDHTRPIQHIDTQTMPMHVPIMIDAESGPDSKPSMIDVEIDHTRPIQHIDTQTMPMYVPIMIDAESGPDNRTHRPCWYDICGCMRWCKPPNAGVEERDPMVGLGTVGAEIECLLIGGNTMSDASTSTEYVRLCIGENNSTDWHLKW